MSGEKNLTDKIGRSFAMLRMTFFPMACRLAILALPWQTRWFADATLAGWPWEQGRLSFYVSWFFIIAAIVIRPPTKMVRSVHFHGFRILFLVLLIFFSVIAAAFDVSALRAVFQWWVQVILLFIFGFTLFNSGIQFRSLATWFAISLLPHAALGIWQFISQEVIGNAWLGIAGQNPQDLGVSVIELNGIRTLRSYGGFPHPNILGGWLAVGYLAVLWLAGSAKQLRGMLIWSVCSMVFIAALFFSFSRGAWLAAAAGVMLFFFFIVRQKFPPGEKFIGLRGTIMVLLFSAITVGAIAFPMRDFVFSRFSQSSRLEMKSTQTRAASLQTGLDIFRRKPFFGTGPNAELLYMKTTDNRQQTTVREPLESPHNTFLLALVNLGVIGSTTLILLILSFLRRQESRRNDLMDSSFRWNDRYVFVICLIALALFDHYLWSYWSGQTLVAIGFLLILLPLKVDD